MTKRMATRALAVALLLTACTGEPQGGRTVKDDLGRAVQMTELQRVVTLAPNLTEIVFAVGGEQKLVATDDFSDEPPQAKTLPKVGGLNASAERIAALRPDLVIATTNGNPPSLEPSLAAAKIPLFVVRTDRVTDIPRAMTLIGGLLGSVKGNEAASALSAAVNAQRRSRTRAPRVLFAVWTEPLYVGGRGTFADDLLRLTGAENAVTVAGWPQLSLEAIAANPPDLLLYPDRSVQPAHVRALIERVPALASATIVPVNENLFTRPGPRVGAAAAALNAILDRWEGENR